MKGIKMTEQVNGEEGLGPSGLIEKMGNSWASESVLKMEAGSDRSTCSMR